MNSSPRITVAIANYNGRALLETTLRSLATQTLRDFSVVVVDDASTDDSVEWLRANWPDVNVVALPERQGVTSVLNVCLRSGRGAFVVLLNNDVELHPHCLQELANTLARYPTAGAAGAKLVDFYDRSVIDGAGDVYEWTGKADRRGHGVHDTGQYEEAGSIFGVCAGVAIYRRSAVEDVGLFDEDFFAFYEDVDWSFRAQLRGLECRYVPAAIAYHMGSATVGRERNDFALYHNWRNAIWVVAKNYPGVALLRYGHRLLEEQWSNLIWALHEGHARVFARVWRDAIRGLPAVLRKRRVVQGSRRVGLRELELVIGRDR